MADISEVTLIVKKEDGTEVSNTTYDIKDKIAREQLNAIPDGTYPDMSVGNVFSDDSYTEDQTPYLYRVSGGGVEVGTVEEDSIVGGTVAWNQLMQKSWITESTTSFGLTITNNGDGTVTIDGTVTDKKTSTIIYAYIKSTSNTDFFHCVKDHKYLFLAPKLPSGVSGKNVRCGSTPTMGYKSANGATIANCLATGDTYFFGRLEDIRTGAVFNNYKYWLNVFDLTQMFGTSVADYIYSLEQSTAGAGVAFFRKLFPKDYYEYNTGELMSVEGVSAHVMRDADDNIIGNYPLDSSLTLRGIPNLSNGLYFDGDTYEADGTVTRKYGIVDMGTLRWIMYSVSEGTLFRAAVNGSAFRYGSRNFICKYPNIYATYRTEGTSSVSANGAIDIIDSSYTDAKSFTSAMSGVMLVYELATPTTESAEPYESIQKVSKYGTEEYVSTGIVPVGHVTKYPTDIVAKVNGLPSDFSTLIAPTEKEFKATKTYSVNQFIIVNNQLYRVTASIANGATITVGTNVTATTVADILTQLLGV